MTPSDPERLAHWLAGLLWHPDLIQIAQQAQARAVTLPPGISGRYGSLTVGRTYYAPGEVGGHGLGIMIESLEAHTVVKRPGRYTYITKRFISTLSVETIERIRYDSQVEIVGPLFETRQEAYLYRLQDLRRRALDQLVEIGKRESSLRKVATILEELETHGFLPSPAR